MNLSPIHDTPSFRHGEPSGSSIRPCTRNTPRVPTRGTQLSVSHFFRIRQSVIYTRIQKKKKNYTRIQTRRDDRPRREISGSYAVPCRLRKFQIQISTFYSAEEFPSTVCVLRPEAGGGGGLSNSAAKTHSCSCAESTTQGESPEAQYSMNMSQVRGGS